MVVALLHADDLVAVTLLTAIEAYVLAGQAHPVVVGVLKPVRKFMDSRFRFPRSPVMLLMLSLALIATTFEVCRGHDQLIGRRVASRVSLGLVLSAASIFIIIRCGINIFESYDRDFSINIWLCLGRQFY